MRTGNGESEWCEVAIEIDIVGCVRGCEGMGLCIMYVYESETSYYVFECCELWAE